ncbi:unnamed protein product [Kluyveromyces dobzhanskii CBS 2104]|uniref:WGS project CCBQ000000000 data, contig 00015 n=1 Tax=Kluyveromyces dobzhanskii CBS 2104 TaxID=1427455 RepID=A0A0A8LBG5_9SACH|nr:unnamed protein product [Kluyveromyces dobzhanskii CBS 2104]
MASAGTDVVKAPAGAEVAVVDGVDRLAPTSGLVSEEGEVSANKQTDASNTTSEARPVMDATYVGWKQIGGWEERDVLTLEDELSGVNEETFLDSVIPDKAYGDWYHAVGVLFVGGFLSFLLGKFKFTLAPVFFVIVGTAIFYRTSIKKYRATIKELAQKEFIVQKVEDDYESMEWLNSFLDKYWPLLEPSVSQIVVEQVNELIAVNEAIPAFVKALWIDRFTLGIKPPRVDLVKTFQNTDTDVVVMDFGMSFTPHDLSDMTSKQLRNYVNQTVVVKAKLFGLTVPVYVSNIAFKARVRVRMKLMTPFPHIETVNIQFLEVPDIDFVCKLFGDTVFNWEIMSIPGLLPLARELAKKYIGPIFLPPFSLQLNVPQLLSGSAVSIGILELTVKNAKDLKRSNSLNISVDPYLEISIADKILGTTRTVKDTLNPIWNESMFLLLGSFTDPLEITVYDKREHLKDRVLGRIYYNLSSLHDTSLQKNVSSQFIRNAKPVGELFFDMKFYPTLEPKKLPDGTVEEVPDLNTGITKITVEEAKDLDESGKPVNSYVELFVNSKLVLTTSTVKGSETPSWNAPYEAVVADRRKTRAKLVVKNNKGEIISSTVQTLNDLIDRTLVKKEWIPLKNGKSSLKVSTQWKPVSLDIGSNAVAYTPPVGVVRVLLNKATALKNLEKFGTIDPYARVLVNGLPKGRTNVVESTLNPVWNEAIYVAVSSPNQKISIECLDVEYAGEDRSLGKFDIPISEMFQKGPDDKYIPHIDDEPKTGNLITKKGARGVVTYYASFYPSVPVLSLEEIQEVDEIAKKKASWTKSKAEFDEGNAKKNAVQKKKLDEEEEELKELEDMYSSKMKLDLDELLQYNSGILSIYVLSGELPQPGCYLQAFFDSGGYPRFVSQKTSTRSFRNALVGDVMIKELEWSVTTFRVTKDRDLNKASDCLCEVTIPTIELLKNCYYKPSILSLTGQDNAKVMVQVSWFPITVSKLPQSDLITNCGDLKVNIKSAENLISADRNGKSDPFVKLYMNDNSNPFYKTKTIKKTLDPTWNESCTVQVSNRVNNYLKVKVMDWDAGNRDDNIGEAIIPLSKIDPENPSEMDIPLSLPTVKKEDAGVIHLSFEFEPRYVLSVSRKETKIGDLAGKGLSAGLKAGTSVIGGGLGSVGKLKKGIFGGGKKKEDEAE